MKSPGNVLLMSPLYPPTVGGIPEYSRQVAQAYARAGLDVTVVTARDGPLGLAREGSVAVHNVHRLSRYRRLHRAGRQLSIFWRLSVCVARLMRARDYDLIHATVWRLSIVPLVLGLGAGTVVSVHGREVFALRGLRKRLSGACLHRVAAIAAVSRPVLDRLRREARHPLSHAVVAWNGCSFRPMAESHTPTHRFSRLFCMCRLVERKNVKGAIQAIGHLRDGGHDVHLFVAGGGPELKSIERERSRLRLEGNVTLLGWIPADEAVRYYRECGIFLHPQIAAEGGNNIEGFGMSIADAMSFGCIPVAGMTGGPSDFVRDGQTGFLVDGRDAAAVAGAVRTVLENPERGREMAREAQRFALENLSWDTHVRDILALVR